MTLPASGQLSMSQIATEFGGAAPHSLSEYYGADVGVPTSGAISFSNFYGKSNLFTLNIASNAVYPNIRALCVAAGWNQFSKVLINVTASRINTIALGSSSFPGGIEIVFSAPTLLASDGVPSLSTSVPVTIDNLGTIAGVGGSGGRGESFYYGSPAQYVNGGAGGLGQRFADGSTTILAAQAGANGQSISFDGFHSAAGGRGGNGGNWGQPGSSGANGVDASGGIVIGSVPPHGGSAGVAAVSGNSYITWKNIGTRLGAVL